MGSPPRVRGKVRLRSPPRRCSRITPARAGKSGAVRTAGSCIRDHPRACGEKMPEQSTYSEVVGSPPRVRGKAAGSPARPSRPGDHPRACGEKGVHVGDLTFDPGSPPRVRGKAALCRFPCPAPGITPARAGKSVLSHVGIDSGWDHPRACGEKVGSLSSTFTHSGSPPRVRGKVSISYRAEATAGITPARAGKRASFPA